jgi:histidinol phosphatase-like PHP family hydrolase
MTSTPDTLLGRYDLHVHTSMSDGDLSLEEVVATAASLGVTVGIADHLSTRNLQRFVSTEAKLRHYLDAVSAAPVFLAGEFCWCDGFPEQLPPELLDRLDYRIGSNHGFALPDGTMGSPWWTALPAPWADRPQEVMELMVANLCDLVRAMPIQIVAHSTFTPAALLKLEPDLHAWWTDEREDRFVDAVVESGVAMEISNRYRLPHDRLLRKAKAAGARFALGSDGHTQQQVARLEWAVETARRVGIGDADLFMPERRRRG